MHYAKQGGQTIDQSGRDRVRANHFRKQAYIKEIRMTDTYGQTSTVSSKSADLQRSLEKWLVVRVDSNSSICYNQAWRRKTTPQQRSVLEHTASAPRTPKGSTNGNDSIGSLKTWATPLRSDGGGGPRNVEIINGRAVRVSKTSGTQHGINLADEVKLSVWPTPTASDKKVSRRTTTDKQQWMHPNAPQHT